MECFIGKASVSCGGMQTINLHLWTENLRVDIRIFKPCTIEIYINGRQWWACNSDGYNWTPASIHVESETSELIRLETGML